MKQRLNRENRWINILALPIICYTIYLLFQIVSCTIQGVAYPNEYREAANIQMTQTIIDGINPYSLDTLKNVIPGTLYLYGPLLSVITAFLSIFIKIDLVMLHYLVSFLAMVISAILMARMVWEHSKSLTAPATAFLFTILCHWRYGFVYAAPDSLGLCILILILFVLTRKKLKQKALLCAILTILIFFTKQYYLMIAGTSFIYFLFLSKKQAIQYAGYGVLLTTLMGGFLYIKCPLYFTYAIYFVKGPGAGAAMGSKGIAHNNSQIMYLGGMFLCLFIVGAYDFIRTVMIKRVVRIKWNLHHFEEPLFLLVVKDEEENYGKRSVLFDLLFWGQMGCAAIVLRYIGNNDGAFLTYYLQLFMPALIVVALCALDSFQINQKLIYTAVYLIFLGFTIWKTDARLVVTKMTAQEVENWQQAYALLDEYQDGDIYYMPVLAYQGFDHGQYVYNSGQPFVITQKYLDKYNKSESAQKFYPYAGEIMEQHLNYRNIVLEKVRNGEYSVVVNKNDMDVVFTEEDLSIRYKKAATIPLRTGSWSWNIDFWVLK